jgi:hypothetical protein
MDYTPKIKKEDLVHGAYYNGRCRNATIARWNGITQRFIYRRVKFGNTFLELICCPEDETRYDVFIAETVAETPFKEIDLNWVP